MEKEKYIASLKFNLEILDDELDYQYSILNEDNEYLVQPTIDKLIVRKYNLEHYIATLSAPQLFAEKIIAVDEANIELAENSVILNDNYEVLLGAPTIAELKSELNLNGLDESDIHDEPIVDAYNMLMYRYAGGIMFFIAKRL